MSDISPQRETTVNAVAVRPATGVDIDAIERVAQRDGRWAPRAPVVVAELEGRILAARSLLDGEIVADPFSRTAHLVEMLELCTTPREQYRSRRSRTPGRLVLSRLQGYARA